MNNKFIFRTILMATGICLISACKQKTDEAKVQEDKATESVKTTAPEYYMQFSATPQQAEAGKQISFSLTPKIKGNESAPVPLESMHEHKIHLIIVDQTLNHYEHLHPEYQADGSYTVSTTLQNGGNYILFAEYMPSGAGNLVDRFELNVAGTPSSAKQKTTPDLISNTDGYEVTFTSAGPLQTNMENHIILRITKSGKEIFTTDLENLMGAKAHLVFISADGREFIHCHPEEEKVIHTHAVFETPGIYRGFLQFQTDGQIHLADFTVQVVAGTSDQKMQQEEHHH